MEMTFKLGSSDKHTEEIPQVETKEESQMSAFNAAFQSIRLDEGKLGLFEIVEEEARRNYVATKIPDAMENKEYYDKFIDMQSYTIGDTAKALNRNRYEKAVENGLFDLDENGNVIDGANHFFGADLLFDKDTIKGFILAKKNGYDENALKTEYQNIVKGKKELFKKAEDDLTGTLLGGLTGYLASPETATDFASPSKIMGSTIVKGALKAFGTESLYVALGETSREASRKRHAQMMDEDRTLWDSVKEIGVNSGFAGAFRGIGSTIVDANTMRQIHNRIGQFSNADDALTDKQIFAQFAKKENDKLTSNSSKHDYLVAKAQEDLENGKVVDVSEHTDIDINTKFTDDTEPVNIIEEIKNNPDVKIDVEVKQAIDNNIDDALKEETDPYFVDDNLLDEFMQDEDFLNDTEVKQLMEEYNLSQGVQEQQAVDTGSDVDTTMFSKFADNLAMGTIAGVETDGEGNITFNPEKFVAGLGGYTALKQAYKSGVFDSLPEEVNKQIKKYFGVDLEMGITDRLPGEKLLDYGKRKTQEKIASGEIPEEGRKVKLKDEDKEFYYGNSGKVYWKSKRGWRETQNFERIKDVKQLVEDPQGYLDRKAQEVIDDAEFDKQLEEAIQKEINQANAPDAYKDQHTAPTRDKDGTTSIDDLTKIYPSDIYSKDAARLYGHNEKAKDDIAMYILRKIKGNPDAEVTIYRAIPKDLDVEINPGDWVTITKQYAKEHGEARFDGNYKILEMKVKAKEVITDGNSIHEQGYDPIIDAPKTKVDGVSYRKSKLTDNDIVNIKPNSKFKGEITLLKNKEKAPNMGSRYGQDVEPSGFFAVQKETNHLDSNPNYETVKADIQNPLIVDVTEDVIQWKKDLSAQYKAKGKALTKKLLKDGYDSIITTDKNGELGEIIILDTSILKGK